MSGVEFPHLSQHPTALVANFSERLAARAKAMAVPCWAFGRTKGPNSGWSSSTQPAVVASLRPGLYSRKYMTCHAYLIHQHDPQWSGRPTRLPHSGATYVKDPTRRAPGSRPSFSQDMSSSSDRGPFFGEVCDALDIAFYSHPTPRTTSKARWIQIQDVVLLQLHFWQAKLLSIWHGGTIRRGHRQPAS